jgi:hypothetical protein
MAERYLPTGSREQRFDGSVWRILPLQHGAAVLTDCGQQLLKRQPSLIPILREYGADVINHGRRPPAVRRWFKSGGNSDVYLLGDEPIVVKESSATYSAWAALDRTDYLYAICERSLPEHIRVPEHYGLVYSTDLAKQYLIMQRANDGLTVENVQEDPQYSSKVKVMVNERFQEAKVLLDCAIENFNAVSGEQRGPLRDWHSGNVIVDFSTPTSQVPFSLWIIDQ